MKLLDVNMYLDASNAKAQLGGICGQNSSAGIITNCIVSGNIKNKAVVGTTAGVAPYSSGTIQACGNLSNVYMEIVGENYNGTNNVCVGGISGSGKVSDSFNCGNITATGKFATSQLTVGGCLGVSNGVEVARCYNTGNVISLVETTGIKEYSVGGVAGLLYQVHGQECYSIGNVNAENATYVGALFGRVSSGATYANLYYNSNSTINAFGNISDSEGMVKTDTEMKSIEFINLLNANTTGAFKQDTNNINNGYPILSWQ